MSLVRKHLSRDLKEMKEWALEIWRGRTGTGKFPEAGTGLMCLRTGRQGWQLCAVREEVGPQ